MKRTNITRFVLSVLAVIAVGLFGIAAVGQLSAGTETTTVYSMTDAHDRGSIAQMQQTRRVGLSDAHERMQTVYGPSDAHDRARAAQGYEAAKGVEKMSDLHSRHTPEELRTLFGR